ncbi:hypothetical protein CEP50_08205 [Actinopolyspora mortivallis]|uniref:Uncharacterized protein n=1 Tax=Actinopolyspora mortivallis TaxID=33906 RepID=A0A2T0GXU3_ACTMO|nr:hypothetical protein CEP50_08205 [Actinopolyspora mortivallis]
MVVNFMSNTRKSMYLIFVAAFFAYFLAGFFSVKIWPDNIVMQRIVGFSGIVVITFITVLAYFGYKKS